MVKTVNRFWLLGVRFRVREKFPSWVSSVIEFVGFVGFAGLLRKASILELASVVPVTVIGLSLVKGGRLTVGGGGARKRSSRLCSLLPKLHPLNPLSSLTAT